MERQIFINEMQARFNLSEQENHKTKRIFHRI